MPDAPGTPDTPKPPVPPVTTSEGNKEQSSSVHAKPTDKTAPVHADWKPLEPGELPPMEASTTGQIFEIDNTQPITIDFTPLATPATFQPPTPSKPTPPPIPATTAKINPPAPKTPPASKPADASEKRPKPKFASFPKFSMLSKKPGELLSRSRRGRPAEAAAPSAPPPPPPVAADKTEAPTASDKSPEPPTAPKLSKVTLDPEHRRRAARPHAEKSPAPRELPTAPGGASVAEAATPAVAPKRKFLGIPSKVIRGTIWVVVRIILIAAVLGLGYLSFNQLRETRLEGFVNLPPGYELKKVCLVRDFRSDVLNLVEDLAVFQGPLRNDIEQLQDQISHAKSDVAGRDERVRLLNEEIDNAGKEIASSLNEARTASEEIWNGPGVQLDSEYAQKKEEFHKKILDRASKLAINYIDNNDFKDPEVWVNAFRLALYDSPKGINAATERAWAENELADWKKYVATYQQTLTDLKHKVEGIQTSPQGRIGEITKRIDDLKTQVADAQAEIEPIQKELQNNQEALNKLLEKQAGLEAPFYKQVVEAPEGGVLVKLGFDSSTNRFNWREINHDPQYQPKEGEPSHYFLWVSAFSPKGQEYWSFQSIDLYYFGTTQVIIQPTALISVRDLINSGAHEKKVN